MSISKADTFAFLSQYEQSVTPVLTSVIRSGHFVLRYYDFPHMFVNEIFVTRADDERYEGLREMFYGYVENNSEGGVELVNEDDYNEVMKNMADKDEALKSIFFELVTEMEASIWDYKKNDFVNKEVRRILGIRNGGDFFEYHPGISSDECNKPLSELLKWYSNSIPDDETKTLEDELIDDIAKIAKRVNEILGKTVMGENGEILDNSVSVFTALDGGFEGGEVYLRVDGKIIDAKPPKGKW